MASRGGKPKPFVQGRKREERGRLIEHPENRIRNETEKSHILLDAAANHGQPQVLMLAEFVADDDELQIVVSFVVGKFALQNRECLDQSVKVLVRPDLSRIKDERVV